MNFTISPKTSHQVFFNYRGEQLRYNFVSHLSDAFGRHDIKFFLDEDELRGKDLEYLFVRIEESSVALAIFSTRYTESRWCMDELVKMKKLADQGKLIVIPIFYKVKTQDVRRQEGEFGDNFWKLARKPSTSGDEIKKWKDALECISDKMGLSLRDNSSEADFIKKIVKEVQKVMGAIGDEEEKKSFGKKERNLGNSYDEFPRFKSKTKKMGLECISDKMGLSLIDNRSKADFVKKIVKEVQKVMEAIEVEKEEKHFGKNKKRKVGGGKCLYDEIVE